MLTFAIKSLLARKLRLLLMLFAILLGTSFVVASFVITDSLRATFDKLVEDIAGTTDLTVRSVQEFGTSDLRAPVDASILDTVLAVDGVLAAEGGVGTAAGVAPIKPDGNPVQTTGAPIFGLNTSTAPELDQFIQMEGRAPEGLDEFNLDIDAAKDGRFVVGERYTVLLPTGPRELSLVGTVAFIDESNPTIGAVLVVFDTPSAQTLLGLEGLYSEIRLLVEPDADTSEVQAAIAALLPPGTEVVDREVTVGEARDEFNEIASIFGNVLLAFALITVVVSAFLINNTFRIVVGQRIRELALLRALGATGRQVTGSVLFEALLLGLVATVVGLGTGTLLGLGLKAMFAASGFELPEGPIRILPRTILAAAFVGIVVTVVSALIPALKVRHVPPVAALRDDFQLRGAGLRRRIITGSVVVVLGVVLLALGLFGSLDTAPLLTMLALGALATFIGVNLLSPVFAVPVARALGAPIARTRGVAGRIARDNAARNPQRTSSTAAALMIGVALVSMTVVVGESIKTTFTSLLDDAVEADFFVQPENSFNPGAGFSPELAAALAARPEIASVQTFRFAMQGIRVEGSPKNVMATRMPGLLDHLDPNVREGDLTGAGPDALMLHKDSARDLGVSVGDRVDVTFVDLQTESLEVVAIYEDATILGNWVVSLDMWDAHFTARVDQFITVRAVDPDNLEAATAAVMAVTASDPSAKAENRAEFKESQERQLDSFLAVIQVMLGFALFIALLGIYNTLRLSIYERTRELGLLRAVGMTRGQMRTMIRWEAAIVAVFGAVLGVVLGVLFGIAAASAVPSSFVKSITIPWWSLVGYLVIAAIAGLLAAVFPARRAARLNILEAVSHS